MNELQLFNHADFGEMRIIHIDGKMYIEATAAAKALGYVNAKAAISRHCMGVVKRAIGVQTGIKADGTPSIQEIEMNFIPEGDLWRLIVRSQLESAQKFERWIFDEVLPTIRQTGAYVTQAAVANASDKATGEATGYIKAMAAIMYKQGSSPHIVAKQAHLSASYFGLPVLSVEEFIKPPAKPPYEQLRLPEAATLLGGEA